jgi:DNA-binding Xre family transcriptional regulator
MLNRLWIADIVATSTTGSNAMNACKSMKIAMVKKDWNQAQMAEATGMSPTAVSRLSNNQNWSCESLKRVAAALDMKVSEFVKLGED